MVSAVTVIVNIWSVFMASLYRHIGVSANGVRLGEDHPKAQLMDDEVELIRELYAKDGWKKMGRPPRGFNGWTYARLAEKFDTNEFTIRDIVKGLRRWKHPSRVKKVRISD